ncbi:MAG: peptidylprolyl isomerase [Gemmatimonadota bacterium]
MTGPDTLSVATLSNWLVLGQPLPVSREVAEGLASHWSDVTALSLMGPDRLRETAVVRSVVWPEVRGAVLDSVLARRLGRTDPPTPEAVDSIYALGSVRLVARVLRRTTPEAHPTERQRQREVAFEIRKRLTEGGSWNDAVARSEDESSRSDGGILGLVERGELDAGLERAVFSLPPGAISTVLETREGYQILFRPRLEDVRSVFTEGLVARRAAAARNALVDSIVAATGPTPVPGAGELVLALAAAGGSPGEAAEPLVRWEGGTLEDTTALRYLVTLPREDRQRLRTGSPADAEQLILEVAGQEILWQALAPQEDPAVQALEKKAWDTARRAWLVTAEEAEAALGSWSAGGGPADRDHRVSDYMEAVVSRRRAPIPVPPAIVARVARDHEIRNDPGGIGAAVDRAARLLESAGAPGG